MTTGETGARIRFKEPDGVREYIVVFPLKRGDEAFRFLDEFEKRLGGPIRDAARDARWRAMIAARVETPKRGRKAA